MPRFQIRKRDDGRGPYRWEHVVRTPSGLARANIYRRCGDELSDAEAEALRALCDEAGFELREANAPRAHSESQPKQ
ncbi:MAG: hypothetical protein AAF642_00795 [Pseudomonadota bacterium]